MPPVAARGVEYPTFCVPLGSEEVVMPTDVTAAAFDWTLAQPVVITMAEIAKDKKTKEISRFCEGLIRLVAISRRD